LPGGESDHLPVVGTLTVSASQTKQVW
jgi:hypothetical protein